VADILPQIVILEKAGVDWRGNGMRFIIPTAAAQWQLESLALMGIPETALVRVTAPIFVDQLFVPSFARREVTNGDFSIVSPRICGWLRDRMLASCGVDASVPSSQDVYISRKMALGRRVINEEALEEALRKMGFQIAVTETMSYSEEVRLFANARTIVGAGGSGLSNVIFSRPPVKMIEISGHEGRCKYPDSTSYSLTAGLGYPFSVYLAKPLKRLAPARFDLVVDVQDFCKFLRQEIS
jgi:capsular polysaccharide biosynthesis protein